MITLGDPSHPIRYAKHCIASAQAVFLSYNMRIHVLSRDGYLKQRAEWADDPKWHPHLAALEVLVTAQRCLGHLKHAEGQAKLLKDVARDFAILGRLEQALYDLQRGGVIDLARLGTGAQKQRAGAADKAAEVRRRVDRREGLIRLMMKHPEWSDTKLAKAEADAESAAGTGGQDPRRAILALLQREGPKLRADAAAKQRGDHPPDHH